MHGGLMIQPEKRDKQSGPQHRVNGPNRLNDFLVVHFLDGTTVSYDPDFLYEHRDDSGNHTLKEDPEGTEELE
jgi:hypothetical protein